MGKEEKEIQALREDIDFLDRVLRGYTIAFIISLEAVILALILRGTTL